VSTLLLRREAPAVRRALALQQLELVAVTSLHEVTKFVHKVEQPPGCCPYRLLKNHRATAPNAPTRTVRAAFR
jgi:hypothetical protein